MSAHSDAARQCGTPPMIGPPETPMTTLRTTKAMPPDALFTRPREDKRAAHAVLQDKLDAFQEARIKELAATLAALGGGK